jgi:hypothetical protein
MRFWVTLERGRTTDDRVFFSSDGFDLRGEVSLPLEADTRHATSISFEVEIDYGDIEENEDCGGK